MRVLYKSIRSSSLKCAKCQIFGTFGTPNTKMKLYQMFQISKIMPHCYSTVSNIMRQYGQQWQNGILLFYCVFLSPLPQISLSSSTLSYFFSLCHSLSLPSPLCSRKLLKITLKKVAADLAASLSSSHQSSLLISPPHSPQLATSCSSFGWFGGFWVCDWVLIWVEVMGGESSDFDGLGWSCGLWFRWVDSGDLSWGCGLRPDHGSRLRLSFDLDSGSRLPVEMWQKRKVVRV